MGTKGRFGTLGGGKSGTAAPAVPDAAETTAFLARTSGLSGTETAAYKALINGIVADGDFASLTGLYIFATKDTTTAALNLIANSNNLTTHGTPTSFVADTGYTGDHSTFYLDTGYVQSVTGNFTSLGVYQPSSRVATQSTWNAMGNALSGTAYSYLATAPTIQFEMSGFTFPSAVNTDSQGAWSVLRSGSTVSVYKNNVATAFTTASDASAGSPTVSLTIFGQHDSITGVGSFSGDLISAAWFGSLSAAGIIRVHNRINAYIATVNSTLNLWIATPPDITLGSVFKYNSGYPTKYVASDTWVSTWADDGNIYVTSCDTVNGGGWQATAPTHNFMFSTLSNATTSMTGSLVNGMTAFGTVAQAGSDGGNYKVFGIISVNGTIYAATARSHGSVNGLGQTVGFSVQIIKSSDHGVTWTPQPPSTAEPYASPMFPTAFPTPSFVQYGQDYQGQTVDNSSLYVYAVSTDVGWNNSSNLLLGRVLISAIGNLSASDWSFWKGTPSDDIANSANWDSNYSNAVSVLTSTLKLGASGIQYVPSAGKYVMMQWYYPSIISGIGFDSSSTVWTLYEATSLKGPWVAKQTIFWPITGLYDARVIPSSVSGNTLMFAASGNFSAGTQDPHTGEYTLQLIPAQLGTPASPAANFLARTSGLSGTETTAYTNLINGLVSDGIITGNLLGGSGGGSILDGLYIFATNSTTTANLNICGTNYGLTSSAAPTFTADHGYTGNGTTMYLDTGFVPSTAGGNTTQNSASFGVYDLTNRAADSSVQLGASASGTIYSYIATRDASTTMNTDLNGASFPSVTSNSVSQGLTSVSRTGAGTISVYKNGSSTALGSPTDSSTGLPTSSYTFFAMNGSIGGATSFTSDQLAAGYFGAGITGAQHLLISNRINAYMTELGINVY